ncbi:hypothetical protein [Cohnella nanjingensis]|uniref:DUF2157 domain-containing protein n=1 Tax=Cohnella nanjingensis TaxID=1387779 RepID=A0A7X0VJ83_9BACL|nr:hypothetical protein [Cohnella nanjingensis]MBB6675293.1 hypothetical protein [Cohnella nanjingensis]
MPALDEDRKKWVVREIETWRRGKLLPEQYCDFLQNLYLDDLTDRPKGAFGEAVRRVGQASGKQWLLVIVIFSLICLVVLHFSAFPAALQIAIAGLGTAGFVGLGAWWRERLPARGLLLIGAGMLYLFGTGMAVLSIHGWTSGTGPIVLLALSSIVWIGCGIALRFAVLHGLGWLGMIGLYGWMLSRQVPDPSWLEVQVFWLPAALLFVWLSWFTHVKLRAAGAVMFATALILWFMPEVYSALLNIDRAWIQLEFLVKIAIAGIGMFRLRKQWMEWVA